MGLGSGLGVQGLGPREKTPGSSQHGVSAMARLHCEAAEACQLGRLSASIYLGVAQNIPYEGLLYLNNGEPNGENMEKEMDTVIR